MGSLANVSNLRIEAYSEHPEVYALADWLVESYFATRQRRRDSEAYKRTARKLIASIWLRDGDLFKFTTKSEHFAGNRKQVWMTSKVLKLFKHLLSLEDPSYINLVASGYSATVSKSGVGANTVYCRSLAFKERLASLSPLDIIPNPDLPRIELRDADKHILEIGEATQAKEWFKRNINVLESHYDLLTDSNITLDSGERVAPSDLFYIRKFKHDLQTGGRLYAAFENWPKAKRLSVLFDGEPCVSMDLSQLHPALIMRYFHKLGAEPAGMLRGELEDAYDMPAYEYWPREVHKKLVNTMFNAASEDSALRSIMTAHLAVEEGHYVCNTYNGKSKRVGKKLFTDNKKGAKSYLNYFKSMHPYYAEAICSGVGSKLQKKDGDIVLAVLGVCNELGCPVLPVHDEFIFPERWLPTMDLILKRSMQSVLGEIGRIGEIGIKIERKSGETEKSSIALDD